MKKLLCIILTAIFVVLSGGCSTNSQPERWLNKKASAEDILSMALEAKLLLEEWNSPKELSPDCFFQYYEALVIYGYVSEQEGESEIDRNIVEDVLRLFFDVEPERMRSETYYNKDNKTYEIEGLGNVLDYQIEQVKELNGEIQITYNLYYSEQFKQSGTLTIQKEDESHYRFVSHKIHQVEDVVHPANQESANQETASPPITDEELCERALYLLDPYVLPVAWWTGGGYSSLSVFSAPDNIIQNENGTYCRVFRFDSIQEMKQMTEQFVTKAYAEKYLYPHEKDYFLEREGNLYLSTAAFCGEWMFTAQSASVVSKTSTVAELSVTFENLYEEKFSFPIFLQLEEHTWKLANTPYVTGSDAVINWNQQDDSAIPSDEQLISRLFSLCDYYTYPIPWFLGAGDDALGTLEVDHEPLPDTPEYTTFFEVSRFDSIDEMKRAVEQVVTQEFAENTLYPYLEKGDFMERDGKLYRNTSLLGSGWGADPASASVLSKSENNAVLSVEFQEYDHIVTGEVQMTKENGIWKIASLPDFLTPSPSQTDEK